MGKFKDGMIKYGHKLKAEFELDFEGQEANRLNNAEQLVTAPVRMIVDPLGGAVMGASYLAIGVPCLAVGVLSFDSDITMVGLGITLLAAVKMGKGACSPLITLLTVPYNGVQAYKHRRRTNEDNVINNAPSELNSSPATILNLLASSEHSANPIRTEAAENITQKKVASPSELIAGPIPDKVQLLIQSFECPITHDLMKDPVICILDGRTYENEYITKWLTEHRYSPLTRERMTSTQKVSDVLKPNRALADAIEGFRVEHPELFENNNQSNSLSMS